MSTVLTSSILSRETLVQFENNLVLTNRADFSYTEKFGKKEDQIGTTYDIRRAPMIGVLTNGGGTTLPNYATSAANVTDTKVRLTIGSALSSFLQFDDGDLSFKIEKFSDRYIKNAVIRLAATFDSFIAEAVSNCKLLNQDVQVGGGWVVGAATSAITTSTLLTAKQYLLDAGCPDDGEIYGVLNPKAMSEITAAQLGLFLPQVVSSIYKKGYLGEFAGVQWAASQSLATHTNGATSTLTIGAGSVVLTAGWAETGDFTVTSTGAAIKAGDVFTVAGVYAVNPLTKATTANLQQFTVVQDYASGVTSVKVSPAPITAGEYQNISTTVASKTASLIGAVGSVNPESIVFHKKAIAVASPELTIPKSSSYDMAEYAKSDDTEMGIRLLRAYDMLGVSGSVGFSTRLDVVAGIKIVVPSFIVRIRN